MRYLEKTFWCSLVIHCISLAFISGCGDASGVLVVSPEVTNLEWKPENDGHQTVDIVLQNNGRGPLTIQKVTTTCSCTVVTSGKKNAINWRENKVVVRRDRSAVWKSGSCRHNRNGF